MDAAGAVSAAGNDTPLLNTVGLTVVRFGNGKRLVWIGEIHEVIEDDVAKGTANIITMLRKVIEDCGERTVDVFVEQSEASLVESAMSKRHASTGAHGGRLMNMTLGHLRRMDTHDSSKILAGVTDCERVRLQLCDPRNLGVYEMIDHFRAKFIKDADAGGLTDAVADEMRREIGLVQQMGYGEVLMCIHLCLQVAQRIESSGAKRFVDIMIKRYFNNWEALTTADGAITKAMDEIHVDGDGELHGGQGYLDIMDSMYDAMDGCLELYILVRAAASDADYLIAYTGDTHRARWNDVLRVPMAKWGFQQVRARDLEKPLTVGEVRAALHDNNKKRREKAEKAPHLSGGGGGDDHGGDSGVDSDSISSSASTGHCSSGADGSNLLLGAWCGVALSQYDAIGRDRYSREDVRGALNKALQGGKLKRGKEWKLLSNLATCDPYWEQEGTNNFVVAHMPSSHYEYQEGGVVGENWMKVPTDLGEIAADVREDGERIRAVLKALVPSIDSEDMAFGPYVSKMGYQVCSFRLDSGRPSWLDDSGALAGGGTNSSIGIIDGVLLVTQGMEDGEQEEARKLLTGGVDEDDQEIGMLSNGYSGGSEFVALYGEKTSKYYGDHSTSCNYLASDVVQKGSEWKDLPQAVRDARVRLEASRFADRLRHGRFVVAMVD